MPKPKVIMWIGIILFLLSFVTPANFGADNIFRFYGGAAIFIQTPLLAFELISEPKGAAPEHNIILCIALLLGWTANFMIFTRLPFTLTLIAMALPWVTYFCYLPLSTTFIPFYLWAFGIGLIHLSRLASPKPPSAFF